MFKVYIDEQVSFTVQAARFDEQQDSALLWFYDDKGKVTAAFSLMEVLAVFDVTKE